jgi:hypothetical protein
MDKNTLLQSVHNPSNLYTLGDAIYAFGKKNIPFLAGNVFIFYTKNIPNKLFQSALNRGRPPHHIKKTDGKIKKIYKTKGKIQSIQFEIHHLSEDKIHKLRSGVLYIERLYSDYLKNKLKNIIIIQKNVRTFLIKINIKIARKLLQDGVNFNEDPITSDIINDPVIILPDWLNNNTFIYNTATIHKLLVIEEKSLYFLLDEDDNTQFYYRSIIQKDIFNNNLYKSPMTRKLFTLFDLKNIKETSWFKIGKNIQNSI